MNNYILKVVLSSFQAVLSLWVLKAYFQTFFEKRENKKCYDLILLFYFVWQVRAILPLNLPVYQKIAINVCFVFCISLLYKGKVFIKMIFTILYNSIWMMLEFLIGFLFIIVGIPYDALNLLGSLLSKFLLLLLVKALQTFFNHESVQGLSKGYSVALMLILNGSMYVVYDSFMMRSDLLRDMNILYSFLSLLIMLVTNILIFNMYLRLSETLVLKRKNLVFEQAINIYDMHIKEKENSVIEFRRAKHDFNNQLIYLIKLSEEERYDELIDYLRKIITLEPFNHILIANTDHSVIDALVNYKYTLAQNLGIDFHINLDVPTELPFANSDICVILGNALDNALEANIRLGSGHRYIKFLMRLDYRNLNILIENSFNGTIRTNKRGKIVTIKEDFDNHGIGMDSIRKAAEKYHGYVMTEYECNVFKLKIILYS